MSTGGGAHVRIRHPRTGTGAGGAVTRDTHGMGYAPMVEAPEGPYYSSVVSDMEALAMPELPAYIVDGRTHILPDSIDLDLFVQDIRPPHVVDSLPSLPDADYPVGDYAFLTTTSVLYVNVADVWTVEDGSTITNGTLVAGLVRAGAIATEQLAADAVIANVANVGGTVLINSSGIQIKDDFGNTGLTSAGFEGSWHRFLGTGLYNDDFALHGPAGFAYEYLDPASAILPYWRFLYRSHSDFDMFLNGSSSPDRGLPGFSWIGLSDLTDPGEAYLGQELVPVIGGLSYLMRIRWQWLDASVSWPIRAAGRVDWYDSTGTYISTTAEDNGNDQTSASGELFEIVGRFTAPIEATSAVVMAGFLWPNGSDDALGDNPNGLLRQVTWQTSYHDHPEGSSGGISIGEIDITSTGALGLTATDDVTFEIPGGTFAADLLRAWSTGDVTLSSTTHGLQIGVDGSLNLAIDDNEIQARNNGAAGTLNINNEGGSVVIGGTKLSIQSARTIVHNMLNMGGNAQLVIASGAISVTQSYHQVDTEGAAATDNLDTISGGVEGDILILRSATSARDVTLRHGVGNLRLAGAANFVLGDSVSTITLLFGETLWHEISRSTNL